jgi:hypothetical protein
MRNLMDDLTIVIMVTLASVLVLGSLSLMLYVVGLIP